MLENEDEIKESKIAGDYCNVDDLKFAAKDAYPNNKDAWQTDDIVGVARQPLTELRGNLVQSLAKPPVSPYQNQQHDQENAAQNPWKHLFHLPHLHSFFRNNSIPAAVQPTISQTEKTIMRSGLPNNEKS